MWRYLYKVFSVEKANSGAFAISCTIGSLNFTKSLCDLGASINLIPLAVYKKLGVGDPNPTNIWLVMVDRSVKRHVVILHDVLVKVADFILPANFAVLDCKVDFEVPIIMRRPFLATGRVIVDRKLNEIKFRLNDKEACFEIRLSMTLQKEMGIFLFIDVYYHDGKSISTGCLGKV